MILRYYFPIKQPGVESPLSCMVFESDGRKFLLKVCLLDIQTPGEGWR